MKACVPGRNKELLSEVLHLVVSKFEEQRIQSDVSQYKSLLEKDANGFDTVEDFIDFYLDGAEVKRTESTWISEALEKIPEQSMDTCESKHDFIALVQYYAYYFNGYSIMTLDKSVKNAIEAL